MNSRKTYVMVLDTETCNSYVDETGKLVLDDSLVYDTGFSIVDLHGNVYEEHSYIVDDVFMKMKELMKTAYYADKIPQYWADIWRDDRKVITFKELKWLIRDKIKQYNITAVACHNARFDVNALNKTERWLTKSKLRYFFPNNVEIWDTLMMANSILSNRASYKKFCTDNGYLTKHSTPRPQLTAEVIYRFIKKDTSFIESHTALEDVQIEREIMWYCFNRKVPMKKVLYEARITTP